VFELTIDDERVTRKLNALGGYAANTYNWGHAVAKEASRALTEATSTWQHHPRVEVLVLSGGRGRGSASVGVSVISRAFHFVDRGTRPHWIFPKKPNGVLAFNADFGAKSRPRRLRAYAGHSRPPKVFTRGVYHPGIEARGFSELAVKRGQRDGVKLVLEDIERILRARTTFDIEAARARGRAVYGR